MISESPQRSRSILVLVLMLLAPVVTGCDSESLVTSDAGHLDTALRLLGPDGTAVGFANVEAIERHADIWFESITGERPERDSMADEFENRTGVDIENDVEAIYVTVHGSVGEEDGSIIVFGTWDTDDVIDHLDDNMEINRIEHDGPESFTAWGIAEQGTLFLAISPEGYMMVTSSEARFESMMARALTADPVVNDDPFLNELTSYDAWMSVNDIRRMLPDMTSRGGEYGMAGGMIGPVFESVSRAGFGMDVADETAEALLLVEPREDVRAEDLANVVRGGIAAARFQVMSDPDAPEMIRDLLDRIEVESRSNSVAVRMSISRSEAAELGQLFQGKW